MKIGILGAGSMGTEFARRWLRHGHEVRLGVRNASRKRKDALVRVLDSLSHGAIVRHLDIPPPKWRYDELQMSVEAGVVDVAEAAHFGEVVVLAVPSQAVPEVLEQAGDLSGKIIIDCTNALKWDAQGPMLAASATEEIILLQPAARVVKVFNTLGAEQLAHLEDRRGGPRPDTFLCGDDAAARQVVRSLAEDIGFSVVDVGPLRNAVVLEHLAVLWFYLATEGELGPDIFFKVVRARDGHTF